MVVESVVQLSCVLQNWQRSCVNSAMVIVVTAEVAENHFLGDVYRWSRRAQGVVSAVSAVKTLFMITTTLCHNICITFAVETLLSLSMFNISL